MDRFMMQFAPLVWPLSILLISLIFRKDLGQALGRVGQVKYRDLELTFRDDLRQAERVARTLPPPAAKSSVLLEVATDEPKLLCGRLIVSPSTSDEPLERHDLPASIVGPEPRQVIETAWGGVAKALARGSKLKDRGSSAGPEGLLIGLLRTIRDRAARLDQPAPSPEEARRFVALARQVTARIEELG